MVLTLGSRIHIMARHWIGYVNFHLFLCEKLLHTLEVNDLFTIVSLGFKDV